MATNGNIIVDTADPKILEFVSRPYIPPRERLPIHPMDSIVARNMVYFKERGEPGSIGNFDVTTYIKRKYVLYRDKQIFGENNIILPLITTLKLEVASILGVNQQQLSSEEMAFIGDSFSSYVAGGAESIAAFVIRRLTEYKQSSGKEIDTELFDIFPAVTVEFVSAKVITDKEDAFKKLYRGSNPPDHMPPGHKEGENLSSDGYSYRHDGDTYLTAAPPRSRDHIVEVPQGATDDDKLQAITERARDDVKKDEGCANNDLTELILPIVKISFWTDKEWRWEWGYRKTCGGGGMHCYWPIEYNRDVDHGIYASLYYPTADNREAIIRKVFEESLQDAVIIAMVTENLDAALEAFKLSFFQRLKDRTVVSIKCIIPNFYAAEVHYEWRRIG